MKYYLIINFSVIRKYVVKVKDSKDNLIDFKYTDDKEKTIAKFKNQYHIIYTIDIATKK